MTKEPVPRDPPVLDRPPNVDTCVPSGIAPSGLAEVLGVPGLDDWPLPSLETKWSDLKTGADPLRVAPGPGDPGADRRPPSEC